MARTLSRTALLALLSIATPSTIRRPAPIEARRPR